MAMAKITKDMLIGDILEIDREMAMFLGNAGMHCLGCPSAQSETLEQAASVHGADADALVDEMNAYLASPQFKATHAAD